MGALFHQLDTWQFMEAGFRLVSGQLPGYRSSPTQSPAPWRPPRPAAALCLANLLESVSRQADAVALLERQVAVAPSEALHEAAGRLQLELDQLELAVMHFNAALGFNPNSAAAAQVCGCGRGREGCLGGRLRRQWL